MNATEEATLQKKVLKNFYALSGEEDISHWPPAKTDTSAKLKAWCTLATKLPTPWPEDMRQKMIKHSPQGKKSSEILRWVHKVKNYKDEKEAKKALEIVFKAGIKPSQYIPHAGVSIVGMAAYVSCQDVVSLSYKYENKESLRLTLTEEHMGPNHPDTGSTLLHRLVERSGSDDQYLQVVRVILKNDPEACLQQTKQGAFPDQMRDNVVSQVCRQTKSELEKQLLEDTTKQSYESKPVSVSVPKKM